MENCVNRTCGKYDTSIRYHCKLPTNEVPNCKKRLTEKPKPVAKLACSDGLNDLPEGCTPADAKVLRQTNHDLVEENESLRQIIEAIVELENSGLMEPSRLSHQTNKARDLLKLW